MFNNQIKVLHVHKAPVTRKRHEYFYTLLYCRMLFGCSELPGCTRLYSAWRKWTSDSCAYSFSPHCSWFRRHHNQSWQLKALKNKLASSVLGLVLHDRREVEKAHLIQVKASVGDLLESFLKLPVVSPASLLLLARSSLLRSHTRVVLPHSKPKAVSQVFFQSEKSDCLQMRCVENILILCRRLEQTNYIILWLH